MKKLLCPCLLSLMLLCCGCDTASLPDSSASPSVHDEPRVIPIQNAAHQYAPANEHQTVDGYYGDELSYDGTSYKWDMCIYDLYLDNSMTPIEEPDSEAADILRGSEAQYLGECGEVQTYAFSWNSAECWLAPDGRILAVWENTSDSSSATHLGAFFSRA